MKHRSLSRLASLCAMLALSCAARGASGVDNAVLANEKDGRNWASFSRTFSEQHYSPLTQINDSNVKRLGLAWSLDLPGINNVASVPLEVNGTIYLAVGEAQVHAVDVRSGKLLWRYDPEVAKVAAYKLRFAWGSRGLAFWQGKVYVGTMDGRLIAINARTGKPVWSVLTTEPGDDRYITGAPRVFNGKVIIGHGGADFGATRGYVTTYDAETGKQLWRFYTVPGDPAKGFENKAMEMAAKTWNGEWWKYGSAGLFGGLTAKFGWQSGVQPRRLLTFALDARAKLPTTPAAGRAVPFDDPGFVVDAAKAARGKDTYFANCFICHGPGAISGGSAPDLRASRIPANAAAFEQVVRQGALSPRGMPT